MKFPKWLRFILLFFTFLLFVFYMGPTQSSFSLSTTIPELSVEESALDAYVAKAEAAVDNIRADNQSRIIWADSSKQKTPYSLVYLHGFTASYAEGEPIHREFAARYGCNLYLPRLHGHGLDEEEPMLSFNPEKLMASALEAIAVAQKLGDQVIIMCTSTGGTLALPIAADNPDIAGLICYSPNIAINNPSAWLLTKPWGLQIARAVTGGKYRMTDSSDDIRKYWTADYRLEAVCRLQRMVEQTMLPEVFARVKQPVFVGYYYKNELEQDPTVSVPAIEAMYNQLGTSPPQKRLVAFPESADHVIASYLRSKDLESVRNETFAFAEEVLELQVREPILEEEAVPQ